MRSGLPAATRDAAGALAGLARCIETFGDGLDSPDLVEARRVIEAEQSLGFLDHGPVGRYRSVRYDSLRPSAPR